MAKTIEVDVNDNLIWLKTMVVVIVWHSLKTLTCDKKLSRRLIFITLPCHVTSAYGDTV